MRLSPAQERALLGIPVRRAFIPAHTGFQWPTLAKLKQLRLINGVRDGLAGKGQDVPHVITPSGLRRRAELAAIADTHPQGGDAKQAPFMSGGGADRQSPKLPIHPQTTD